MSDQNAFDLAVTQLLHGETAPLTALARTGSIEAICTALNTYRQTDIGAAQRTADLRDPDAFMLARSQLFNNAAAGNLRGVEQSLELMDAVSTARKQTVKGLGN